MKKTTSASVIRYIDDTTAQVTKAFEKKACIFGTEEFKLWREYKAMFPNAKMVPKSINKNPNQKTRRNMTLPMSSSFRSKYACSVTVTLECPRSLLNV